MDFLNVLMSAIYSISSIFFPNVGSANQIETRSVEMVVENSTDEIETTVEDFPTNEELQQPQTQKKYRFTWEVVPSAVKYQLVVLKENYDTWQNVVYAKDDVYTNGLEVDLSQFSNADEFYWKVCPLNYETQAIAEFSPLKSVKGYEINSNSPTPTTQFDSMPYPPLYPVYSWIPVAIPTDDNPFGENAKFHEVEVVQIDLDSNEVYYVRSIIGEEYDVYDEYSYNRSGRYFWRVRSITEDGFALSDWSDFVPMNVTAPTTVAAFGDSITHGGGAMTVPPGFLMYNWETYCNVPVKNLGHSGDTTQAMLNRFEKDVLPFAPKILIIMGGVNDFREEYISGWTSVHNLALIRQKCEQNGIIPIFLTPTPINAELMKHYKFVETPPIEWRKNQQIINDWVLKQDYHIDINTSLADSNGNLIDTSDGLHPNMQGKKIIGELVANYLHEHFEDLLSE